MKRLLALALLAGYSLVVAQLTLRDPEHGRWAFSFADRLATSASSGRLSWDRTEVLANVALFVPYGFLLRILLGRAWAAVLLCVLISAGIELAQQAYLPTRVPTVADVEHNALGGLLGALLASLLTTFGRAGSPGRA
ncbi:MAG: VanZ family protein [Nocardioidaceae bacterium]|nr:VanZ family protein [Nocardioidaceae bacterium]